MMLIHLLVGTAVVGLTIVAGAAYLLGRPRSVATIAAWALGLLIVQAATGMFLLTATEEGPGPLHIVLPMTGLAAAAVVRLARSESGFRRDPLAGVVYSLVAAGALVGLITGLAGG
jgi:hypothetical protein